MSKKGHKKVTMTKTGHQNVRCKNYKPSHVTELCHFFIPALTTGHMSYHIVPVLTKTCLCAQILVVISALIAQQAACSTEDHCCCQIQTGFRVTWPSLYRFSKLLWLVYTANTDKTRLSCLVLSCPCLRCQLNWRQVKTVCNWKFLNSFVQSRHAVWTKSCLVLKCVHTADETKLFRLQYIENCLRLSRTQFTLPRQVKTRQSCLVRFCGMN